MVEIGRNGNPLWLEAFLRAKFYEHCKNGHYNDRFCIDCMGEAFCHADKRCKEEAVKHEHHSVLSVYRGSYEATTHIVDVRGLLDISGIQPYSINSYDILYVHRTGAKEVVEDGKNIPRCEVCKKKIKEKKYLYCSILCKFNDDMSLGFNGWLGEGESGVGGTCNSYVKRSRKGIPKRSPLF